MSAVLVLGWIRLLVGLFALASIVAAGAAESYELSFSTYLGGSGYEHIRDVCADRYANVYVTGGTTSTDFRATPGAFQRSLAGSFDIFVVKFNSDGELVWSTLVGGKDYDRRAARQCLHGIPPRETAILRWPESHPSILAKCTSLLRWNRPTSVGVNLNLLRLDNPMRVSVAAHAQRCLPS